MTRAEEIAQQHMGGTLHSLILAAQMKDPGDREELVNSSENEVYRRITEAMRSYAKEERQAERMIHCSFGCQCFACNEMRAARIREGGPKENGPKIRGCAYHPQSERCPTCTRPPAKRVREGGNA